MIARVWQTKVAPHREGDFRRFVAGRSRAMFLAQNGCLGVLFVRVGEHAHAACSLWRSQEDIVALAHSSSYQDTALALSRSGILTGEASVETYLVEGGVADSARLMEVLAYLGSNA